MILIICEYVKVIGEQVVEVDWELVVKVYRAQIGLLVKVGVCGSQLEENELVGQAVD